MDDSIELVMVLPGETAKKYRKQFAAIIRRHFAGDQSLHAEIDANATSNHPVAQMARESLTLPDADASRHSVGLKRRREEREELTLEQARVMSLMDDHDRVCSNSSLDERTRLFLKNKLQGLMIKDKSDESALWRKIVDGGGCIIDPKYQDDIMFKSSLREVLAHTTYMANQIARLNLQQDYVRIFNDKKDSDECLFNDILFARFVKSMIKDSAPKDDDDDDIPAAGQRSKSRVCLALADD